MQKNKPFFTVAVLKMEIFLPDNIKFVLNRLQEYGFECFIVGGCVRDLLLNETPNDYDVTTNALPNEIKDIFEKTVDTGIKHGTVTVIIDGEPIEVTTYRTENGYSDCRRPDSVNFVSNIERDLARRDFTVNAICYNQNIGFKDCFGGMDDIKNKLLRAVGNPEERFTEDALRILRLFRFSSVLGFEIEKETYLSALKCSNLLKKVSMERIATELKKTALGSKTEAILPLIEKDALGFINLKNTFQIDKISKLPKTDNLRFFALLNLCSTDLTQTVCLLKLSNNFKNYCKSMSELEKEEIVCDKVSIKKLLQKYGYDILIDFYYYKNVFYNSDMASIKKLTDDIIENKEPYCINHLAINGNDLKNLGIKDKNIGKSLQRLLKEVITKPELNTKEQLTEIIKK